MSVRLIKAPISIEFSEITSANEDELYKEYHQLSEADDDPINQWLKLAKARGETNETDPVLLNLLVELHKKVDSLEMLLKGEKRSLLDLDHSLDIESIGFEHFKLKKASLKEGAHYYARISMPVHPKRDIPLFFDAKDSSLAKISRIHERDEKEWNIYLTARERVLIREARTK